MNSLYTPMVVIRIVRLPIYINNTLHRRYFVEQKEMINILILFAMLAFYT